MKVDQNHNRPERPSKRWQKITYKENTDNLSPIYSSSMDKFRGCHQAQCLNLQVLGFAFSAVLSSCDYGWLHAVYIAVCIIYTKHFSAYFCAWFLNGRLVKSAARVIQKFKENKILLECRSCNFSN